VLRSYFPIVTTTTYFDLTTLAYIEYKSRARKSAWLPASYNDKGKWDDIHQFQKNKHSTLSENVMQKKKGKIRTCTEMLIFSHRCKLQQCVSSSEVTTAAAQKRARATADETWVVLVFFQLKSMNSDSEPS